MAERAAYLVDEVLPQVPVRVNGFDEPSSSKHSGSKSNQGLPTFRKSLI